MQAPVSWEPVDVTPILKDGRTAIPDAAIESIERNKVALKGPLAVSSQRPDAIATHFRHSCLTLAVSSENPY